MNITEIYDLITDHDLVSDSTSSRHLTFQIFDLRLKPLGDLGHHAIQIIAGQRSCLATIRAMHPEGDLVFDRHLRGQAVQCAEQGQSGTLITSQAVSDS